MRFIRTASTGVCWPPSSASWSRSRPARRSPSPPPDPVRCRRPSRWPRAAPGARGAAVTGITADISFTNNLIDASNFTGEPSDPILQGATGRLWLSGDHRLRLELQSDNGDAQIVVNKQLVLDL